MNKMAKDKTQKSNNSAKKRRNPLILLLLIVLMEAVVLIAFTFITTRTISLSGLLATLKSPTYYVILIILSGTVGIYTLVNWRLSEKRAVMKENNLANSHWMTERELRKSNAFYVTNLIELPNLKDGIPLRIKIKKKKSDVVILKKPIHAVVLGTTGSGKTTGYLDPTIQAMAKFQTKPCMIVTDPKGELYRHHREFLTEQGYTVHILDFRHPYQSTMFNPFQPIIDRIILLKGQVVNRKGKYYIGSMVYETYADAHNKAQLEKQVIMDEIYENLQDIVYTMCPIKDGKEPGWEEGARNFIFGLCLCFVDDVINGVIPVEQLNLYNLYRNLSLYCTEDMDLMKLYFDMHKDNVKAYGLAKTVLLTSERTLTSYLSKVTNYISWMADSGIQYMTSKNEISLCSFDQSPNAIFLVFPDEKDNRHILVSLFVVQAYKSLVYRADLNLRNGITKDAELAKNCYFLLDEFGNLPKINKFDSMTSVGRSRRLFFLCVLQSFAQLDSVYGKETARIIKGQLQIKIYLGTDDKETVEEFSWLCGKKKIYSFSASVGIGKDANDTYSAKEQPLITTDELMTLNNADSMGNAVISHFGMPPMMSKFTPAYKAPSIYKIGSKLPEPREAAIFDAKGIEFDIYQIVAQNAIPEENDEMFSAQEIAIEQQQAELDEKQNALVEKLYGLQNAIQNKVAWLREFIPADLFTSLINNDASGIEEFLNSFSGANAIAYELCYVKNLIDRATKTRQKISQTSEQEDSYE